jgi:hypothetical protein
MSFLGDLTFDLKLLMKIKYKDLILMVKCVAKKEHNCVLFNNKKTLVFVFTLLSKTNKKVFDVYYR